VTDLARALEEFLDAPNDVMLQMGEAARARAIQRHAIDTEAAKLGRLFRKEVL
jgi:colanic acid/amylovoran biosynthesis glycosyltransferase